MEKWKHLLPAAQRVDHLVFPSLHCQIQNVHVKQQDKHKTPWSSHLLFTLILLRFSHDSLFPIKQSGWNMARGTKSALLSILTVQKVRQCPRGSCGGKNKIFQIKTAFTKSSKLSKTQFPLLLFVWSYFQAVSASTATHFSDPETWKQFLPYVWR